MIITLTKIGESGSEAPIVFNVRDQDELSDVSGNYQINITRDVSISGDRALAS